jgi:hypothetical protein
VKRKARAIMDMRQWLKFSSTVASSRAATRADVVAIHQHVLKSTTRPGSLLWFIWCVSFVLLS